MNSVGLSQRPKRDPVNPGFALLCLAQRRGAQTETPRWLQPPSFISNRLVVLEDAAAGTFRTGAAYHYDHEKRQYVLPGSGADAEMRFPDNNYGKCAAIACIWQLAEEGEDCGRLLPSLLRTLGDKGHPWFVQLEIMRTIEKIALSGSDCREAKQSLQDAKALYEQVNSPYLAELMNFHARREDCIKAANDALEAIALVENNRLVRSNVQHMKLYLRGLLAAVRTEGKRPRVPLVVVDRLTGMGFVYRGKGNGFEDIGKYPLLKRAVDFRPPMWGRNETTALIENPSTISIWAPTCEPLSTAFSQILLGALRDPRISVSP
ncbi:Uncharacterised protein [Candidatus Burarchaeum australiense]|nr:Uncharacterised protein [Candidatus Burarchaeum australiense]